MPIHKQKNEHFFKKWSPKMAYILGFFAADGNLTKGKRENHYIEFTSTDKKLLGKIRETLESNHKISNRREKDEWKTRYRLQIGSKIMFKDLSALGLTPKKSKRLNFLQAPSEYFSHFIRGYFDGDGSIWYGFLHKLRKTPTPTLRLVFTSGSKKFIKGLAESLKRRLKIDGVTTYYSRAYRLVFSKNAALSLYKFMYNNPEIHLARKKKVFERYLNGVVV